MLTQKEYISAFKLNTGEEIIAKVIDESPNGTWYKIQKPLQLIPGDPKDPMSQPVFVPIVGMFDFESDIELNTHGIMLKGKADKQIKAAYEQVLSPLVLPKSSLVV